MKTFICLFALFALFAVAAAHPNWEQFKSAHNKKYSQLEEVFRRIIFETNVARIALHNAFNKDYQLSVNRFADLTHDEFNSAFNGYRAGHKLPAPEKHVVKTPVSALPSSVDWRNASLVTPVKDQAQCGSCWAFSAVASLEGQHAKATKNLVSLSEQQLVDCSQAEGNQGCNGGLMDQAFDYIKQNGGLDTEESYPYTGEDGQCQANPKTIGATLKSWTDVEANNEDALLEAVATVGPISVAIDATFELQFYGGGIFDDSTCSPDELNHGVTVVGYGSENGKNFWIVKNSWGESWGESGYFRMIRGKNMCGVATDASYPVV